MKMSRLVLELIFTEHQFFFRVITLSFVIIGVIALLVYMSCTIRHQVDIYKKPLSIFKSMQKHPS